MTYRAKAFLIFIGLVLMSETQMASAQTYDYLVLPNGGVVRRYIPGSESEAKIAERFQNEVLELELNLNGTGVLLDSLSVGDINSLSSVELLDSQRKPIEKILTEYREAVKNTKDAKQRITEKNKYAAKLQEILLPEQLSALAAWHRIDKKILKRLLTTKVAESIELTPKQRQKIIESSKRANEAIAKAIAEVQRITDRERARLKKVYAEVLTIEQQKKFEKSFGIDALIKQMSLKDLKMDSADIR